MVLSKTNILILIYDIKMNKSNLISISDKNKKCILELGKMGETFNDVITKLLDSYEKHK